MAIIIKPPPFFEDAEKYTCSDRGISNTMEYIVGHLVSATVVGQAASMQQ